MGMSNQRDSNLVRRSVQAGTFGILVALLASCDGGRQAHEVTVVGTDYAFEVPKALPAGQTSFALENRGRVDHEMVLARLKPGITLRQALEAQARGADADEITDQSAGVLFADPGQTSPSKLMLDLTSGRTYALICFFRDSEKAPPHAAMGMVASFEVQ